MTPQQPTENQIKVSQELPKLIGHIDQILKEIVGVKLGFALIVYTDYLAQYASNCDRKEVIDSIKALFERWGEGLPDIPEHLKHSDNIVNGQIKLNLSDDMLDIFDRYKRDMGLQTQSEDPVLSDAELLCQLIGRGMKYGLPGRAFIDPKSDMPSK